jgi:hypothetical protein
MLDAGLEGGCWEVKKGVASFGVGVIMFGVLWENTELIVRGPCFCRGDKGGLIGTGVNLYGTDYGV